MRDLLKLVLLIFINLTTYIFIYVNQDAFASNFVHNFNFVYEINETGNANVSLDVITTNKTDIDYIKSIELELPFRITNIDISKSKSPIEVRRFTGDSNLNLYILAIDFLNPVIGNDKSFEWNLSFTVENVVLEHGVQKTIILPKVMLDNVFIKSTVYVKIPKSLGNLQYVYGAQLLESTYDDKFVLFYTSGNSNDNFDQHLGRNLIVLLGEYALYTFNVDIVNPSRKIILPISNHLQSVFYDENLNWNDLNIYFNQNSFLLDAYNVLKETKLTGQIVTYKNIDNYYPNNKKDNFSCNIQSVEDKHLVSFINDLNNTDINIYDKAKKMYVYLSRYKIVDYNNIYSGNFFEVLNGIRSDLNVFELNSLYRYMLCLGGVESRFVLGYVFPIQPLRRSENKTYQHTWIEFWNGERWISVDPSWYISSKGDLYFDKNNFHHITFLYFYETYNPVLEIFKEQKDFFNIEAISDLTKYNLDLLNENKIEKKINLLLHDQAQIGKKIKATAINATRKFLIIDNLKIDCDICLNNSKYKNFVLKPFSSAEFLFDVENLGIILGNKEVNVNIEIYFYDDVNKARYFRESEEFKILLKSNLNLHFIFFINIMTSFLVLFRISKDI